MYKKGGFFSVLGWGKPDEQYLDSWRDAPLTYQKGDDDYTWHHDYYEHLIGHDETGRVFARARDLLLRGDFYPPQIMSKVTDAERENRYLRVGDRIVQRIRAFGIAGLPLLEVVTMNVYTKVWDEPRLAGFTYTTTAAHLEIGAWTGQVLWRDNLDVMLLIKSISKTAMNEQRAARVRKLQEAAHKQGIAHFVKRSQIA